MRFLLLTLACFLPHWLFSQKQDLHQISAEISTEGKRLYRLEKAAWNATDLVVEKYSDLSSKIGGYFSYEENDRVKCIFFNRDPAGKVIATVSFDSTFSVQTATAENLERPFSTIEQELFTIRSKAFQLITQDTLFKQYKNTALNSIPIVQGQNKRVYVLTGPQESGVVIFGNDYLITFDEQNNILTKRALHKNIIPIQYGKKKKEEIILATSHTHLPETGDFISATDICTLMLYSQFAKWPQHYVLSAKYVSIWDCDHNQLTILTQKAFEKINLLHQKKKE